MHVDSCSVFVYVLRREHHQLFFLIIVIINYWN